MMATSWMHHCTQQGSELSAQLLGLLMSEPAMSYACGVLLALVLFVIEPAMSCALFCLNSLVFIVSNIIGVSYAFAELLLQLCYPFAGCMTSAQFLTCYCLSLCKCGALGVCFVDHVCTQCLSTTFIARSVSVRCRSVIYKAASQYCECWGHGISIVCGLPLHTK